MPIIKGKTDPNAVIYTDGFKTYDGLVRYAYKKHYQVKHFENEFVNGSNHINEIENFWRLKSDRRSSEVPWNAQTHLLPAHQRM